MNDVITCPICMQSVAPNTAYCGNCGFALKSELAATVAEPEDAPDSRQVRPAPLVAGLVALGSVGGVAASLGACDCCCCDREKAEPRGGRRAGARKVRYEQVPWTLFMGVPDERKIRAITERYMRAGWQYGGRSESVGCLSIGAHTTLTFYR